MSCSHGAFELRRSRIITTIADLAAPAAAWIRRRAASFAASWLRVAPCSHPRQGPTALLRQGKLFQNPARAARRSIPASAKARHDDACQMIEVFQRVRTQHRRRAEQQRSENRHWLRRHQELHRHGADRRSRPAPTFLRATRDVGILNAQVAWERMSASSDPSISATGALASGQFTGLARIVDRQDDNRSRAVRVSPCHRCRAHTAPRNMA